MSTAKIYGLIGFPVKHSLSPAMHNAAFKALGINAEYRLFEVPPGQLDYFLEKNKNKICGFNVTVPHKEKILGFIKLNQKSFYLREVKAVNTIIRRASSWIGFNTDIPGFSRHLKEQFNPRNKKVALLGAGGAARAVVYALARVSVKEIAVFDIDKEKSVGIIDMIKGLSPGLNIYSVANIEQLDIINKDLLINATPVGLKDTDPCLVEQNMLHKNLFVYDLIYNPSETKLLQFAKVAGAQYSNGLGMLLYQGMLAFKIFTNKEAPMDVMNQALIEAIRKV